MPPETQILEVWGDLACFARPETKAERFTYPVITPSAARAIFDAIYCKPGEFRWQPTSVEVLSEPSYIALRRNEVKEKASVDAITKWMKGSQEPVPIMADVDRKYWGSDTRGRTQRQTIALKNVRYRLHATIKPWPDYSDRLAGIQAQFRRRARLGKCFYQPYFGCREFPAFFSLIEDKAGLPPPEPLDIDLGLMLYDVFDLSRPGSKDDSPSISLFRAKICDGVMHVPDYESPEVLKAIRRKR